MIVSFDEAREELIQHNKTLLKKGMYDRNWLKGVTDPYNPNDSEVRVYIKILEDEREHQAKIQHGKAVYDALSEQDADDLTEWFWEEHGNCYSW